jgi:nitrite reductase/ring-hydroxylating ferredoxin subunit
MGRTVAIARADDWQNGVISAIEVENRRLALCRLDDAFFAFDDHCPHAGSTLGLGILQGNVVECPRHEFLWRVTDGAALTSGGPLKMLHVWVEDGNVMLEIPDPWPEPAHWARHPNREELRRRHGFAAD